MNMSVCLLTCIHVPALALFGVYDLCTCVYAFGRASTCLFRPLSVCTSCARVCIPLDVHSRDGSSPFRCERPVYLRHVYLRLWTCIHVPVPAFLVCTLCARVFMPLDVHPRPCTGLFRWIRLDMHPLTRIGLFRFVHPVHAPVRLWMLNHVPVPALFRFYTLFMCVYASARATACLNRPFPV